MFRRNGFIGRAKKALRGQDFEGEPRDREFDSITSIQFDIDDKEVTVEESDGTETLLTGVYKVEIDEKITISGLYCSSFENRSRLQMSFDPPAVGEFEEARGSLTIWEK